MKPINTLTSSKIQIVGKRVCEECGAKVPIVRTEKDGKDVEISDCLNCETLEIGKELTAFRNAMDARENEVLYDRFSIVPDDLESASFENYIPEHPTQKEAFKKAKWYADNFGKLDFNSLLIKGPYGVGKSHLAKAISEIVKRSGYKVIYIDIPSLLRKIKNTFKGNFTDEEIYKVIEEADLVVFDDLGAEYVKKENGESWVGEVLFEMFSSRTNKAKIITTNESSQGLRDKYGNNGGRIVSRMMKGTKVIQVEGKDLRIDEF